MVLKVMQIYVPKGTDETVNKLLEEREVLSRWRDNDLGQMVVHLLVPAEETEPIMDRFEQEFSDTEGFHVILFPVGAVLPRPQLEPAEDESRTASEPEEVRFGNQRLSREELYTQVTEGLDNTRVFLVLTILSAIVAAVGLLRDDVAVIIGAMVIAPLLVPNVAMSLATTLGDFTLLRRALVANLVGLTAAFGCAVGIGFLIPISGDIPAIASRTKTEFLDIWLALVAGSAGTLAFTQGLSGAVIGVMVAVALMPPLVVSGMLLGDGDVRLACGALLLTSANLICINLAGVATFLAQGVWPRSWWEAERAKQATWQALVILLVLLSILGMVLWLNTKN
ncbi:TIGR00341 family protein [bacterium]|nr:TIGR00341 family protein [bacterium]